MEEVSKKLMPGNLVIIESTIPVGTTEKIVTFLQESTALHAKKDFFVAHCPERAVPGNLFSELINNDRILGGICQKSCDLAYDLYSKFVKGYLLSTNDKAAEMVKLIENSSRDVQIAFANQVADMCNSVDINPYNVIELANRHPRVQILQPTCGVGGHCIAVDPWFLIETFPQSSSLLKEARKINNHKPITITNQALQQAIHFKSIYKRKPNVLGLGLSFKPDVEDIRESPALLISKELNKHTSKLNFLNYDPHVPISSTPSISRSKNLKEDLKKADIVIVLVKHSKLTTLAEEFFLNKIVIDACGLLYDVQKINTQKKAKESLVIANNI